MVKHNMTASDVKDLHNNSDVDSSPLAQHHTLGKGAHQAAAGDHTHDPNRSHALALLTANQAIGAGAFVTLNNLTVLQKSSDIGYGLGLFTLTKAGLYRFSATVYFDSLTAGYRACRFAINGINQDYVAIPQVGAAAFMTVVNTFTVNLAANSTVSFQAGTETAMNAVGSLAGLGKTQYVIERLSA